MFICERKNTQKASTLSSSGSRPPRRGQGVVYLAVASWEQSVLLKPHQTAPAFIKAPVLLEASPFNSSAWKWFATRGKQAEKVLCEGAWDKWVPPCASMRWAREEIGTFAQVEERCLTQSYPKGSAGYTTLTAMSCFLDSSKERRSEAWSYPAFKHKKS